MLKIIRRNKRKEHKLINLIVNHVKNHKREYLIACILFFIGSIFGIIFINNINDEKSTQICEYVKSLLSNIQNTEINYSSLLKNSIISNIIIILILWLAPSTIIGIPFVYAEISFRGFVLGYTISSILISIGIKNGILCNISILLLHNIIFIPVLLGASVSGMKLYNSIIKNKQKENVKFEFLRHTFFCIIMFFLLVISSLVEVYLSTNLLIIILKIIKI